jgi:hypothetical protein
MMAAFDAGKDPSPGTINDAVAELDDTLKALRIHIFHALVIQDNMEEADKYWQLALQLAELKGSILAQKLFNSSLKKTIDELVKTPQPQADSVAKAMVATTCVNCQTREAKVWEKGEAYCKQCAKALGIDFHGKV